MSAPDEKTVTEREAVLREREAFAVGCSDALHHFGWESSPRFASWPGSAHLAAARYPLPKVTRPRVVTDGHDSTIQYRFVDGGLEYRIADAPWMSMGSPSEVWSQDNYPTPTRVALWADLIANPVEEVDA